LIEESVHVILHKLLRSAVKSTFINKMGNILQHLCHRLKSSHVGSVAMLCKMPSLPSLKTETSTSCWRE